MGGLALFLKFVLSSLKGKCVKLGIIALLFSCVNRATEECGSEIQLLLE